MDKKQIDTDYRRYLFEATRRNTGQCHVKLTISTIDSSPHPSLTPDPGRHEVREKESDTYKKCLNGMYDLVKEDDVLIQATKWIEGLE